MRQSVHEANNFKKSSKETQLSYITPQKLLKRKKKLFKMLLIYIPLT